MKFIRVEKLEDVLGHLECITAKNKNFFAHAAVIVALEELKKYYEEGEIECVKKSLKKSKQKLK